MKHLLLLPFALCCCSATSSNLPKEQNAGDRRTTLPNQAASAAAPDGTLVYRDPKAPVERRVEDLLGRMTPLEKTEMVAGADWMETRPNPRLGIPAIKMADGPMGVRHWTISSAIAEPGKPPPITATAFPASIGMAASWDPELVRAEGRTIAQQAKALGRDMLLAPTVNIQRTPLWGRNFEGYGEDPYLAARMAVAYVQGVQGEGVIATVKHFAANNQEYERHRIDEQVELRTLHEIYFPAFKATVEEGKVLSVMSAYNKVNGQYCAENGFLLTEVLKKSWGFQGFVVSDWGSTYSTAGTLRAGMDLEMPGGDPMRTWASSAEFRAAGRGAGWLTADKVNAALAAHQLEMTVVDDSVRRILRSMFTAGLFDRTLAGGGETDTAEQKAVARRAATESMVLLKNDRDLLPLSRQKTRSIALIGPNAGVARPGGGGSSQVRSKSAISPVNGLMNAAGPAVEIGYAPGVLLPGDEAREGSVADGRALRQAAVALAARSEVAVVVVGNSPKLESEGFDRPSMDLPKGQDELIEAVANANKKTIVVVVAGAPVTMTRWVAKVPALLYAWYGGQELGNAMGDLLFGVVDPCGKSPVTFPKRIEDTTAYGNYPGKDLRVSYAEGIYVGYRGFDQKRLEPLFPFGHGLTYTKFEYGGLKLDPTVPKVGANVRVSFQVKNVGSRAGTEVVQVYLHDAKSSLDRPPKELKGFRRISLKPGESQEVTLTLDRAAMSFFDPKRRSWVAEPGVFEVLVGASSRDLPLKGEFRLEGGQ
jgi:beta-glucosidase